MAEPTPVYPRLGDSFNPSVSQSESAREIFSGSASGTSLTISSTKNSNTIFSFVTGTFGTGSGSLYTASFQAKVNGGPWTSILATNLKTNGTSTFINGVTGAEDALYKVTFPGDVRINVSALTSGSIRVLANSSN